MGNVKFGDISTKDLDLIVQAPPTYNFPEKDVEIQHIPGRNGDIVIDKNCYKNVSRTYSIASIFRSGTDFIANSERIIEWLTSKSGYQRLEDSYDPDVYRMATFKDNGSLVNYWDQVTALNVTFECKPQRYLKSGERAIEFDGNEAEVYNPTLMPALPKITISNLSVDADHVVMMTIENYKQEVESLVTISTSNAFTSMTIDSEDQLVYEIEGNNVKNLSEYVSFNGLDFPKLQMKNSSIEINKYLKEIENVTKYSTLIDNNKKTIFVLYKPYETLLESKQDEATLKTFSQLIDENKETYPAEAYSNYCLEHSDHIKFDSFNEIINKNSITIDFNMSLFAKPVFKPIPYKQYSKGSGHWGAGGVWKVDSYAKYNVGDIFVVKVNEYPDTKEYGWKLYIVRTKFTANGQDMYGWPRPLNNSWVEAYTSATEDYRSASPKASSSSLYGWEILPSEAEMPNTVTGDSEKQFVLIAYLAKNKESDETYTKANNTYMFLYQTDFTKIVINENNNEFRYGAFVLVKDNSSNDQGMDSIKYIECIPEEYQELLRSAYNPSLDNIAKDFYNNVPVGHNILDIFPNLKNIIASDHSCSITLFKAKWVFDDENDKIGHPELDLSLEDSNNYIEQKVVYSVKMPDDPDYIESANEYDSTHTYNKGDYCIYKYRYYKCNHNGTTGAWEKSYWDALDYNNGDGTEILGVKYTALASFYSYNDNQSGITSIFSSLFGSLLNSSGWILVHENDPIDAVEWNSREKAFIYKTGLKETSEYTIERYCMDADNLEQYENIILEDVYVNDENGKPLLDSAGNKVNKIIEARFQITEVDEKMKIIKKIMPNSTGFYKILNDSGNPIDEYYDNWRSCTENVEINVSNYNMKTTKSYQFVFIEKAPNYQNEKEYPEWLDIDPILYNSNHVQAITDLDKLNAEYYDFMVKETAWYRYIYIKNNTQMKTEWGLIQQDNTIGQLGTGEYRSVDNIVTFDKIEKISNSDRFPINKFNYVSHEPDSSLGDNNTYVIIEDQETWDDLVYSTDKVYTINDSCIYNGVYYKCLDNNVTGTFNPSKWASVGVPIIVEKYDEETLYTENNFCLYGRTVYKCVQPTSGEWDPDDWKQIGNYVKDVGFYYLDESGNQVEYPGNIPDTWATIKIVKGFKSDFTDTQLEFYYNADGYYKWDTNIEWLKKDPFDPEELMVAGNATSDTLLYYLDELPSYEDLDPNLYETKIDTSASGNPEYVEIKVIEPGFYKVESDANYKYYLAGSILTKISIYEGPSLVHLEETQDPSLANLNISITPRWWKL